MVSLGRLHCMWQTPVELATSKLVLSSIPWASLLPRALVESWLVPVQTLCTPWHAPDVTEHYLRIISCPD